MRRLAPLVALATALLLAACGGDSAAPSSTMPAALLGSWQAGPACRAAGCSVTARVEGSSVVLPLTDSVRLTMDVHPTGGIVSTLAFGSQLPHTVQGTGRVQGNTLVVDYPPGTPPDTVAFATQGALLRFDFQNALQLGDVNGDGVPDRLRITVLFARR